MCSGAAPPATRPPCRAIAPWPQARRRTSGSTRSAATWSRRSPWPSTSTIRPSPNQVPRPLGRGLPACVSCRRHAPTRLTQRFESLPSPDRSRLVAPSESKRSVCTPVSARFSRHESYRYSSRLGNQLSQVMVRRDLAHRFYLNSTSLLCISLFKLLYPCSYHWVLKSKASLLAVVGCPCRTRYGSYIKVLPLFVNGWFSAERDMSSRSGRLYSGRQGGGRSDPGQAWMATA